ncbi:MAG: nitrate- and nitrite sensing domain-containing protein [Campylobacterota bacterium]|nr:nitrate- and nitrite sensing domain-containing protein [Campylobacterota bacterium]
MRILLIITMIIFSLEAKSLFSNSEQADNSVYIGSLKDLVIATQKTRGLTNSYLNGNTVAMLLVYNNRGDMKKAIGIMESLPLAADPIINSRATTISQSLIKLNNKAFKQKPAETFSQYTEQIGQILMLAQTVSKRASKELNPFGQEASTIMMETMLPMTEYTGQMRGFGSGLAAKKSANKTELEKIYVLSNEIKNLNTQLSIQMKQLLSKYPNKLPSSINDEIEAVNKTVTTYTSFAENKFTKDVKNINPNDYFDNGTKLIKQIIKSYNTINDAILEDSKGWL